MDANMILWNALLKHRGHNVSIVSYGNIDNPVDVCLECEDCGEVILDAELYTLCARDGWPMRKIQNWDCRIFRSDES